VARKATFSEDHPLWNKLLDMRLAGAFIADLVVEAHRQGYNDLTYHGIQRGLSRSPQYFGQSARGALWLKNKYAAVADQIDAFETMRGLTGESLARLQKFYIDLAAADTDERRYFLEHEYIPVEMNRAYRFAQSLGELEIKLKHALGIPAMPNPPMVGQANVLVLGQGDIQAFSLGLGQAYMKLIGAATPEEAAVEHFGSDNVRPMRDEGEDPGDEEYE
jgi:hypothetical protein